MKRVVPAEEKKAIDVPSRVIMVNGKLKFI
jgi:hypothetical protein